VGSAAWLRSTDTHWYILLVVKYPGMIDVIEVETGVSECIVCLRKCSREVK
jgi:hypothetical protein